MSLVRVEAHSCPVVIRARKHHSARMTTTTRRGVRLVRFLLGTITGATIVIITWANWRTVAAWAFSRGDH